jgi:hypothetical protein
MPVTQNGSYDVPVMARRDLHGAYRSYSTSRISSAAHSVLYSPAQFLTYVKTQLVNGYSAIRDRFTHQSSQQESPGLINSSLSHGDTRYSRSSSQSSTSGQTGNYNLRRRPPVHSTPRDHDSEQHKIISKQRKDRQSQDGSEDEGEEKYHKEETDDDDDQKENIIVRAFNKILHSPLDLLSFIFRKFFGLPWWLLIPLLLFLGFYACKYISSFVFFKSIFVFI